MSVKNFFKKIDPQEDFDREDDYDAPYGDEAYNDRRRDDSRDGSRDDRRDGSRDDSRRYDRYSRNDRNDRYDAEDDYYAADTRSSRRDSSRDDSYDRRDDSRNDRYGRRDDSRDDRYDRRSDRRDDSRNDRYDRRDDRRAYDDEDTGAYEEDRYASYRDYDYNSRRDRYEDDSWRDRSAGRNDYADEPVEEEPEVKTPEIECFLPMAYAESRQGIVDCLRDGNIAVVDVSCLEVEPMTRLTDCLVGAALALELTLCRVEDSTIMVICPPEAELDLAALRAEMESFKADVLSDDDLPGDLPGDATDASDADAADAE